MLIIENSTISGNSTIGNGGGLYIGGEFNIVNTTISNNHALNSGGGASILDDASGQIVNSTFYGNSAHYGGAISTNEGTQTTILNSTVTGNYAYRGGAIFDDGDLSIGNSIFAGNGSNTGDGIYDAGGGTFSTLGGNIFSDPGFAQEGDIYSTNIASIFNETCTDPVTGVTSGRLRDNGGPVETVLLSATGIALNAGDAGLLPADTLDLDGDADVGEDLPVDGRGADRILDGLDIGAVELAIINGTENADVLSTGEFSALLNGLGGSDNLSGGDGRDSISGGADDDTIFGGENDDSLGGDAGRDSLVGGSGDDFLHGFGSHDSLGGGAGNDDLRGGFGRIC